MSFSVSYNFIAKDKFSAATRKIQRAIKKVTRAAQTASRFAKKMGQSLDKASRKVKNFGKRLTSLGSSAFKRITLPILAFGAAILGAAGQIEKMETGFVGMLGSAEKAKKIVKDLVEFTAKTPFQLGDVSGAARKLIAAMVPVKKMQERLQMLGDLSAAANVPLSDMASIFAKIKNKGKAMTEEIIQLSDRGLPLIDTLSRGLGRTKSEIFDLASKGKISFAIMVKAMQNMTAKGGVANKAMILQSRTLFGLISTLKDNIILTAAAIGGEFLPEAKKFALQAIDVTQKIGKWVVKNKELVKMLGKIAAVLAIVGPILIGIGIAVKGFALAMAGAVIVAKAFAVVMAFISSPILIIIGLIAFLVYGILKFTGIWDKMTSKIANLGGAAWDKIKSFIGLGSTDINLNSKHEVSHKASKPVMSSSARNTFEGNMSIDIRDKGKYIEAVRFIQNGGLNVGLSGVGR